MVFSVYIINYLGIYNLIKQKKHQHISSVHCQSLMGVIPIYEAKIVQPRHNCPKKSTSLIVTSDIQMMHSYQAIMVCGHASHLIMCLKLSGIVALHLGPHVERDL